MSTPWERAADALRNADGLELDEALRLVREAYQPIEPTQPGSIVMATSPGTVGVSFYIHDGSGWRLDGDSSPIPWANVCRPGWDVTELEPAGRVGTLLDELTEALEAGKDYAQRVGLVRGIVTKWAAKE